MEIIQISTTYVEKDDYTYVFGLGNDGQVYTWLPGSVEWKLHEF